ncbi:HAD family hydrolase [Halalkalibacter hemicellulosilyticus]|uniref:Phosphoglycolate phosphatase n=1 Tax=Halalkalibacter hemicellulosilyticusJCM 9152 TaxID=1236971 RepID=W4QNH1_9BACI|nr:HAD-IA family hydrolase [Halalkalibacter hemicellulosilyticus]GAE32889.1 phosphoglycolate phosphatase [Halalkalibacter hemicellulosilyticusJCM 9152]
MVFESSQIKGVLFDLDGTLINSEWLGTESYNYGIQKILNKELTKSDKQYLLGKPFNALNDLFPFLTVTETEKIIAETLGYYRKYHHQIKEYEGIKEMLQGLKNKGYKLGLVTAKLKNNATKELENTGLFPFFEVIMRKEDCYEFKPSPVPLLQLAEKLNLKPIECLYIGDQPTDIQATHSANMISVAALWGEGKMERLCPLNPNYLFKSPKQLTKLLS